MLPDWQDLELKSISTGVPGTSYQNPRTQPFGKSATANPNIGAEIGTYTFFFLGGVLIIIIVYWAPKPYSNH